MKTIIVYWSGTGNTESLAYDIAKGMQNASANAQVCPVGDTTPEQAAAYDKIVLGCPAMGAEMLEEQVFEPFYQQLKPLIYGKPIALFGSYDWGDGEWMRNWALDAEANGLCVIDTLIQQCTDADAAEGIRFGQAIAAATS